MEKIWFAHRGFHQKYVENTSAAFQAAYENGFNGVELDLQLTSDDQIVIFHDFSTRRLSNQDVLVKDLSLAEIKNLTLRNKWKFFNKHQAQVLSLTDFLKIFYAKFVCINLEIKSGCKLPVLETCLLKELKPYQNFYEKIIISSFDLKALKILSELDRNLKLAFLVDDFNSVTREMELWSSICSFLCVKEKVFWQNTAFFQKIGFPLIVWNVKRKKHFQRLNESSIVFDQIMDKKFFI